MEIKGFEGFSISKSKNGDLWYKFGECEDWKVCNSSQTTPFNDLYHLVRQRTFDSYDHDRVQELVDIIKAFEDDKTVVSVNPEDLEGIVKNLMNFLSEFHFEPNFRFVNTFAYACKEGREKEYVDNYFKLTDSPYQNSVEEKMKSPEWKIVVDGFKGVTPSKRINRRFKIFYGSQGTGKTTLAVKESEDCMVCHSAMLPSDLMEDFKFNEGKAEFQPSALYKAMEEGKTITLDEINLLPFESLRFLQSILDGKSEFTYKGKTVTIKEGFSIVGTMNLVVNGCTYALPEPLVDRAYDLKEFKLTEKNLAFALM